MQSHLPLVKAGPFRHVQVEDTSFWFDEFFFRQAYPDAYAFLQKLGALQGPLHSDVSLTATELVEFTKHIVPHLNPYFQWTVAGQR